MFTCLATSQHFVDLLLAVTRVLCHHFALFERLDAYLIKGTSRKLNDMEPINDDLGLGENLMNNRLISCIHVHGDRLDPSTFSE